jgi:glycosyltransferase involved in cell wall biosynthesis
LLDNEIDRSKWEILIVDGMSDDRTREIVADYSKRYPFIRQIDNPDRIKPIALNLGIRQSQGEYIMRIDSHSTYQPGYVDTLLSEIRKGEVQNVGGVQIADTSGGGFWGAAICAAVSHPLAMGNALHRFEMSGGPRFVDTVYCGCYPRSVFGRIGLFNEKLIRTQDREFNERLLRSGGKILLLPHVKAYYTPRDSIRSHVQWTYQGAKWLFKARHYTDVSMTRLRNFAPLAFLFYLCACMLVTAASAPASLVIMTWLPLVVYFLVLFAEGVRQALQVSRWSLAMSFPTIVFVTHLAYGVGTLVGLLTQKDDSRR